MDLEGILTLSLVGLVGSLITAILFLYPLWRSLSRAGFPPAWSLLVLIPYFWPVAILAVFGVLAFGSWPSVAGAPEATSWRAISPTSWKPVSPEEAARNRCYGFEGWILAFYGTTALATVMSVGNAFYPLSTAAFQQVYGLTPGWATIVTGLVVVWGIVVLILIPLKRRLVPKLLIAGIWLYMLIFGAIVLVWGNASPMFFAALVSGVFFSLLFSWYWLKSKRVNVTYLNRIPAG